MLLIRHPIRQKTAKQQLNVSSVTGDRHNTAMHPGPAPRHWRLPPTAPQHGGEEVINHTAPPAVSSQCTEVCGEGIAARSCSKICLVKVYPINKPENAVKMYAILDDQSNRSLAKSEFFDLFSIQGNLSPYSLKTCAGVTQMTGRKADGFRSRQWMEE